MDEKAKQMAKDAIKEAVKKKIIAAIAAGGGVGSIALVIFIALLVIMIPLLMVAAFLGGDSSNNVSNPVEQEFRRKVEEYVQKYKDQNITVDPSIIVATIYYPIQTINMTDEELEKQYANPDNEDSNSTEEQLKGKDARLRDLFNNLVVNGEVNYVHYQEYLANTYILKYKEFEPYYIDQSDKNEAIENIIESIKMTADTVSKELGYSSPTTNTLGTYEGSIPEADLEFMSVPFSVSYSLGSLFGPRGTQGYIHRGIDCWQTNLANHDILAIADGTVYKTAPAGASCTYDSNAGTCLNCTNKVGNQVVIKHEINGNVYFSLYYHLKSYSVRTGQTITRGQIIGQIGTTGCSTDTHLHFSMKNADGNYINPGNLF